MEAVVFIVRIPPGILIKTSSRDSIRNYYRDSITSSPRSYSMDFNTSSSRNPIRNPISSSFSDSIRSSSGDSIVIFSRVPLGIPSRVPPGSDSFRIMTFRIRSFRVKTFDRMDDSHKPVSYKTGNVLKKAYSSLYVKRSPIKFCEMSLPRSTWDSSRDSIRNSSKVHIRSS